MSRIELSRKYAWERKHVERVLELHNSKCQTHFTIEGRPEDLNPLLKGNRSWDWDCRDEMTGKSMAIEVKRITNENREAKAGEIDKLLEQIKNGVAGKLTGTFALSFHVQEEYQFPFKRQPSNRNLFTEAICEVVKKCAKSLDIGETVGLTQMVNKRLTSFKIPDDSFLELKKVSKAGNKLLVVSGHPKAAREGHFKTGHLK